MTEHKILFLGPEDSPLLAWLRGQGERVVQRAEKLTPSFLDEGAFTFLVSYGFRYIIRKKTLGRFPRRAVNLHVSYLPWNRGADPNLWSFLDDTPKGVTIHYLDPGVDTGDIIAQLEVRFAGEGETLTTTYHKLQATIQELFKERWPQIRDGTCPRMAQVGQGTTHRMTDKEPFESLLTDGWDTPVARLVGRARESNG